MQCLRWKRQSAAALNESCGVNNRSIAVTVAMIKLDPIIAVKSVDASSKWYQKVFSFLRAHGGDNFAVLTCNEGGIVLCLHRWDEQHPTMTDPNLVAGNGLILYFRTEKLDAIHENAVKAGCVIEEAIHVNPNSLKREFSLRDPDGYFLTVTEHHEYAG
jgi:uncharacterized glyoxalase superfamily protein PhnB